METVRQISVSDWDKLVESTYGKPYSFQQQDGCKERGIESVSTNEDWLEDFGNFTIPEIINGDERGVSFKSWLERDPKAPLNPTNKELKDCPYYYGSSNRKEWVEDKGHISMFWERNFYPHVSMIAKDLCEKGLLEPGEFQIHIDW